MLLTQRQLHAFAEVQTVLEVFNVAEIAGHFVGHLDTRTRGGENEVVPTTGEESNGYLLSNNSNGYYLSNNR